MLVEEFNAVMDNAEKLVVGEKYSYPKLMEALGLPVKSKGSTRLKQIERLKQYLNWDSKTRVFYGINEDAVPLIRNNTGDYYESLKNCFSGELNAYIEEHKNQMTLTIGYDKFLQMCGIISNTFKLTKRGFARIKASEKLGVTSESIRVYRDRLRVDAIEIADNMLKNMKKNGLIDYNNIIMFMLFERDERGNIVKEKNKDGQYVKKATFRTASDEEVEMLSNAKNKILERMLPNVDANKRSFVIRNNSKQYKEFREGVLNYMRMKYNINIDGFFNGYELELSSFKGKCDDDFFLAKQQVKNKFQVKMINCKDKAYLKAIEKEEGNFDDNASVISKLNEIMIVGNEEFHKDLSDSLFKHDTDEHKKEILDDMDADERNFKENERNIKEKRVYNKGRLNKIDSLFELGNEEEAEDLYDEYFKAVF